MASDSYGSTWISTFRSPIQNTTITASHKHLYSSKPAFQHHNCQNVRCSCIDRWSRDPLSTNWATPSLFQVLLSTPTAESKSGNRTRVSTVFKLLPFLARRLPSGWILAMLNARNVNQKHLWLFGSETEAIPLLNLSFTSKGYSVYCNFWKLGLHNASEQKKPWGFATVAARRILSRFAFKRAPAREDRTGLCSALQVNPPLPTFPRVRNQPRQRTCRQPELLAEGARVATPISRWNRTPAPTVPVQA